jgi:transcriptional regulator with XRE-family HTH domain
LEFALVPYQHPKLNVRRYLRMRDERGLKNEQVAEAAGISRITISRAVRGHRVASTTIEAIERALLSLPVRVSHLIEHEPQEVASWAKLRLAKEDTHVHPRISISARRDTDNVGFAKEIAPDGPVVPSVVKSLVDGAEPVSAQLVITKDFVGLMGSVAFW